MSGMKVFMKVENMPGSAMEANRKDWSELRGFSHDLKYPFDMRENMGRGEPQHGPCTVTKAIDKASPKLYEALAKKKAVGEVILEFERDKPGEGSTETYFRITLTGCRVITARPHIPGLGERDENTPPHMEEIGYAYRKIDWVWLSGGNVPTTFDFENPTA